MNEEDIIKITGYKTVGKRKQKFGLVRCPICKKVEERRIRKDSSSNCRECAMRLIRESKKPSMYGLDGETNKDHPYHKLYNVWRGIIRRCYDPSMTGYEHYGAKGVTVSEEWKNSFKSFKEWSLKNGYSQDLVIDKDILCEKLKINPKVYSPETCIWVTPFENVPRTITEEMAKYMAKKIENYEIHPEIFAKEFNVKYVTILSRTRPYRTSRLNPFKLKEINLTTPRD